MLNVEELINLIYFRKERTFGIWNTNVGILCYQLQWCKWSGNQNCVQKVLWMIKEYLLNIFFVYRNIQYHIFGTFVQQLMLLLIGYLTFYFEVSDFTVSQILSCRIIWIFFLLCMFFCLSKLKTILITKVNSMLKNFCSG